MADLLVYLEEMRSGAARAASARRRPSPHRRTGRTDRAAAPPRPRQRRQPALAQSPLDLIADLPQHEAPAMPAPAPAMPQPAPVDAWRRRHRHAACTATERAATASPRQMPRGPQRQPIDPNLPPDTPLEPGSGAPRIKPGSAAARIAASEAALGHARPMAPETGGKSAAIAAARNAAKAAYLDTPVKVPKSLGRKPRNWLKWPFKKSGQGCSGRAAVPSAARAGARSLPPMPAPMPAPMPSTMPTPMAIDDGADAPLSRGKKILKL